MFVTPTNTSCIINFFPPPLPYQEVFVTNFQFSLNLKFKEMSIILD